MALYGTQVSYTLPGAGEVVNAADVNIIAQPLIDQHDFKDTLVALQAVLVPTHGLVKYVRGYGHYVFVTSGTYSASTAASPWILTATDGTAGRWVRDLTAEGNATIVRVIPATRPIGHQIDLAPQTFNAVIVPPNATDLRQYPDRLLFLNVNAGANLACHAFFNLNPYLKDGATITRVYAFLDGEAGHAALPTTMPAFSVYRTPTTAYAGAVQLLAAGWTIDSSANTAAYQAAHTVQFTPDQNNVVDLDLYSYTLAIHNEASTNAINLLQISGFAVEMTCNGVL